ncbi:NAD(+) synthetase [Clostridia bacterium]|nr:NAD(+) synthetase [Clostridia bacterium]
MDWLAEINKRAAWLREQLEDSGAKGFIYGNSGGKDSALAGILCRRASANTLGLHMPCYTHGKTPEDREHAALVSEKFEIPLKTIDLTDLRALFIDRVQWHTMLDGDTLHDIVDYLRMTTLYTIASAEHRLVVGSANRSELYIGRFTKYGDGARDLLPLADLTSTEVRECLKSLDVPAAIYDKISSSGHFEGHTDEDDIGLKYSDLDAYLFTGVASDFDRVLIERRHRESAYKRNPAKKYEKSMGVG